MSEQQILNFDTVGNNNNNEYYYYIRLKEDEDYGNPKNRWVIWETEDFGDVTFTLPTWVAKNKKLSNKSNVVFYDSVQDFLKNSLCLQKYYICRSDGKEWEVDGKTDEGELNFVNKEGNQTAKELICVK